MKYISVIYWSGTGNTEAMAEAVVKGIVNSEEDVDVKLIRVEDATVLDVQDADAVALGCPSMGDEVLEESEMEPFVDSVLSDLAGKPVALFGSYDWGNGEWMEKWETQMMGCGAILVASGVIANLAPDDEALEQCEELGSTLVASL